MGLDKAIFYGKEHRHPYYKAKAVSPTCRNHGTCPWCEANRKYKYIRKNKQTLKELKNFKKGIDI